MRHPILIHRVTWNNKLLQIWYEMYLEGRMEFRKGLSLLEFAEIWVEELKGYTSTYVAFQGDNFLGIGTLDYKYPVLEPHILLYGKQSPRTCLEIYTTFFQYVLLNPKVQGCLLRCTIKYRRIFEYLSSKGILKFYKYVDTKIRGREYWYIFTGNDYKGVL